MGRARPRHACRFLAPDYRRCSGRSKMTQRSFFSRVMSMTPRVRKVAITGGIGQREMTQTRGSGSLLGHRQGHWLTSPGQRATGNPRAASSGPAGPRDGAPKEAGLFSEAASPGKDPHGPRGGVGRREIVHGRTRAERRGHAVPLVAIRMVRPGACATSPPNSSMPVSAPVVAVPIVRCASARRVRICCVNPGAWTANDSRFPTLPWMLVGNHLLRPGSVQRGHDPGDACVLTGRGQEDKKRQAVT